MSRKWQIIECITSILLGIAIDHQMIPNVTTKVYEFFPEYKRTKWDQDKYDINLKHLLTMTAGLDWNEEIVLLSCWKTHLRR